MYELFDCLLLLAESSMLRNLSRRVQACADR